MGDIAKVAVPVNQRLRETARQVGDASEEDAPPSSPAHGAQHGVYGVRTPNAPIEGISCGRQDATGIKERVAHCSGFGSTSRGLHLGAIQYQGNTSAF